MATSLVNGSLSSWVYLKLELSRPCKLRDQIDVVGGKHYRDKLKGMQAELSPADKP